MAHETVKFRVYEELMYHRVVEQGIVALEMVSHEKFEKPTRHAKAII